MRIVPRKILGGELGQVLCTPNDHVNMAQSTHDVNPESIRLGAACGASMIAVHHGTICKQLLKQGT